MTRGWPALATAVLVAACSSSGGGSSNATLTGFGAARADWVTHHAAHRDLTLGPGCCYGPRVVDADAVGTTYTWTVDPSDAQVVNIKHHFAAGTSQAHALRAVENQDLPADATRGRTARAGLCRTWIYRSAALERADGGRLGDSISVALYTSLHGDPYNADNVATAIESVGDDPTNPC